MPTLVIPRADGKGEPYRIKVSGMRFARSTQYHNKQLGHVATRELRARSVVCLARIPGFDHSRASIAASAITSRKAPK